MRKLLGTVGLAALLAAFGCSGGDSTGPAPSRKLSEPMPPGTTGKPAATEAAGKPAASGGAITPENTKIEFVGAAPDHKHDGGFKKFSGSIQPIDGDITKATIKVEIETDSIWTDDDAKMKRLTGHLKTPDFFDVRQYPTATFVSKEIKPEKKDDANYVILGDLTLHGTTKAISFPATIATTDDTLKLDATFTIDRTEFGIAYDPAKVKKEVTIKVAAKVARK